MRVLALVLLGACSFQDFDSLQGGDAGTDVIVVDVPTFVLCRDEDEDDLWGPGSLHGG